MAENGAEQRPPVVRVELALPEAQLILNALTERPHREVAQLIPNLMAQIRAQLQQEPVKPQAEEV